LESVVGDAGVRVTDVIAALSDAAGNKSAISIDKNIIRFFIEIFLFKEYFILRNNS